MSPTPTRQIALAFPAGLAFLERILQGFSNYARTQGGWSFTRAPELLDNSISWLESWSGDGALVLLTHPDAAAVAGRLSFPVVNLSSYLSGLSIPSVTVDNRKIGAMAAEYFLARHFRRFAYYGVSGFYYSQLRREGFVRRLERENLGCELLEVSAPGGAQSWSHQEKALQQWLADLESPVAILASTDQRAALVAQACAALNRRVPDEVAILGVDNDAVTCEFSRPPLSSVSRNDFEVGWSAAVILDRLMQGGAAPGTPTLVSPDRVVERRSTDTLAIEDARVLAAVRYVQEHLERSFGVEALLEANPLSRRQLESCFQKSLGCTPYHFINQSRVQRACQILETQPQCKLGAVARQCGFTDLRRFRLVFERHTGLTPAAYRRSRKTER